MALTSEGPMALTIFHNPRCSKSRKTLELIKDAGIEPQIRLYLEDAPTAEEIVDVAARLGTAVSDLLRRGESDFKEATDLPNLEDDTALATWVAAHPIVLERPIVLDSDSRKAVVGRPPENVQALLP
jgi:arsenate reductase